jgi:uncharacterized membrane protein YdcZ (DUF606 family)
VPRGKRLARIAPADRAWKLTLASRRLTKPGLHDSAQLPGLRYATIRVAATLPPGGPVSSKAMEVMDSSHATARARQPEVSSGLRYSPSVVVYSVTIFLSAFLLFQVQLISGKYILPRFGGSPAVWNTCLLIFQVLLLAGYGYAHLLSTRLTAKAQARVHLTLLALSLVMLAFLGYEWRSPITPGAEWKPVQGGNPVWQLTRFLATSVGIPFFLLSTTGPLLQAWFSRTHKQSPYRLYALSNLGSLLGLVTYPLVFERVLTLHSQSWLWSSAYGAFLLACAACAAGVGHYQIPAQIRSKTLAADKASRPSRTTIFLWIALPACASAMLLATTNLITTDIAVVPLLWVLPLCIYLLSFIFCFQSDRWYKRGIFQGLYVVAFLLTLQELSVPFGSNVPAQLGALCLTLFAVCMVCHGELARSKPAYAHLSTFYFMLSAGGALGSVFVVLIAPHIFHDIGEFSLTLLASGGLLLAVVMLDKSSWFHRKRLYRAAALLSVILLMIQGYRYEMAVIPFEARGVVRFRARNFFGVKTIKEDSIAFWLLHGNTLHGAQLKDSSLRDEPTQYYKRLSGVGLLLDQYPRPIDSAGRPRALRVGVIGLGVGTLASYGHAGDYFRFYEIDSQVVGFSVSRSPVFTFLKDSPATIDIVMGDARLSLTEEADQGHFQKFDVLVLDAFSSDSVPVHLLTKEAMALYLRHLSGPDAVMAFHLSNRSLDLRPVVAGLGREYNLATTEVVQPSFSEWLLVSANPQMLLLPAIHEHSRPMNVNKTIPLWTDEYSNLFQLLATR